LALALEQSLMRALFNEHTETSSFLDKFLADEFLIRLQNGEGIDSIFGGDIPYRGHGIAFFEHAVEYHMDDTVTKLAIDRLIVIPFTIHPVLQTPETARDPADCWFCFMW
jgi:hypothetical protein